MAGRVVQRPASVPVLAVAQVDDPQTARAFDATQDAVQDAQTQIRRLRVGLDESSSSLTALADGLAALTSDVSSITGRYLGARLFTGSGTYTPTAGVTQVLVRMVGGGGGGGGAGGGANVATGGGGGSGVLLVIATGTPGVALTGGAFSCGAAGTGGANTGGTGGTGGDTTLVVNGVTYTAKGGTGGLGIASTAGTADLTGGVGQTGSTTGSGVLYETSSNGIHGFLIAAGGTFPGDGASSPLGTGGLGAHNGGPVGAGRGFGAGGGGSAAAAVGVAGGAGSAGAIVIEEYS